MQSVLEWSIARFQQSLQATSNFFNSSLFTFAGEGFSISSIVELAIQAIVVIIVSNILKQLLLKRILPKVGIEVGTREALSTITSYVVTVIGFLIVLQTAGINLSSLTVFAGAIGIGVGIGLQNLSSNFISGLTLLFEQPIKVGDYIEVEQLAGIVETIAIRSTTIRTVNDVFVIVPNSRFLDHPVVNWSYRDPRCCIAIPVKVAENSDSLAVMEALLSAARQEDRVVSSPPPEVFFKGIEQGALVFELAVWIQEPMVMNSIKSSLQFLIEAELRDRTISTQIATSIVIENFTATLPELQNDAASDNKLDSISGWKLRDLLQNMSYFDQCSEVEIRQLIEKGYRKKVAAGEIISRENDPGDSFYIILSGAVEVFVESIDQQLAIRRAGEFIGEMSLLLGTPRTATLRAVEETVLFVVDRDNLQSLLQNHDELADNIAEAVSQRQETLKSLGITVDKDTKEETPFQQVRKRIQAIFEI